MIERAINVPPHYRKSPCGSEPQVVLKQAVEIFAVKFIAKKFNKFQALIIVRPV